MSFLSTCLKFASTTEVEHETGNLVGSGMSALAQTVPAGTRITVRTDSQINSASAHVGQSFHADLVKNLVVDGKTIAKAGAPTKGKVTYAKPSGRLHAPGQVTIRLISIQLGDGKTLPVSTSGFSAKGKSHTKSNVTKIGGRGCDPYRDDNHLHYHSKRYGENEVTCGSARGVGACAMALAFGLAALFWPAKFMSFFQILLFPWAASCRAIRANGIAAIGLALLLLVMRLTRNG